MFVIGRGAWGVTLYDGHTKKSTWLASWILHFFSITSSILYTFWLWVPPWVQIPIQTLESLKWEGQTLLFWLGSWLKSVTELLGANFKRVPTVLLYDCFVQTSLTSLNFCGHAMNLNPKESDILYDIDTLPHDNFW